VGDRIKNCRYKNFQIAKLEPLLTLPLNFGQISTVIFISVQRKFWVFLNALGLSGKDDLSLTPKQTANTQLTATLKCPTEIRNPLSNRSSHSID
jgi:hypothetical protein